MVQEILKNIDLKVDEEISKINSLKEKAILELEKKHRKEAIKARNKDLEDLKAKARSKIETFSLEKRTENNFIVLKEKNKIIDQVYKEAEERVSSSPEFNKWIRSLLPDKIEGKIKAGKNTALALRGVAKLEKMDEEGFVIINNKVDLDFRISEILGQFKGDPEVISLLFLC